MKKAIRIVIGFFICLYVIAQYMPAGTDEAQAAEGLAGDDEQTDTLEDVLIKSHYRVWKDLTDANRALRFSVSSADGTRSNYFRNTVTVDETSTDAVFWNSLYYQLYKHDQPLVMPLRDSILSLAHREHIQGADLMYTVTSFVQDIQYNYIMSADSCAAYTDYPCVPNQRFGILSPIEFLYTLAGDCDTRTVLLFSLLKSLGFDPVIVNSREYRHSMLAVDLPSQGDYFVHKGRKFYFWETTSTGWMPGMLPPGMNNPDYWTVILDYEYQANPARYY